MEFDYDVLSSDGTLAVALRGELDVTVAPAFGTDVARQVPGHRAAVLDASSLEFCDSGGLAALVAIARTAEQAQASFRLVGVAPNLHRIIEIVGMLEVLGVEGA